MTTMGLVFALLTVLCWGGASLVDKLALRGMMPIQGVMIRSLAVAAFLLLFVLPFQLKSGAIFRIGWRPMMWVVTSGLLATLLGQWTLYSALKHNEVSRVVPLCSTYPVVAALLGLLFLGESFSLQKGIGIAMVVGGVILLK